ASAGTGEAGGELEWRGYPFGRRWGRPAGVPQADWRATVKGRGPRSAGTALLAAAIASMLVIGWDVSPIRSVHHRTEVLGVQYDRSTRDTRSELAVPDPLTAARNDEPAAPPP